MNSKKYTPSDEFMNLYNEKSKALTTNLDKKAIQREIVNRYRFRTQACNDIHYLTILAAEEQIDRNYAVKELQKLLGEFHLAHEMEKGLFEYALTHITTNKQQNFLVKSVYMHHLNTLCRNLDPTDPGVENTTLLPLIKEGDMDSFFVPFLTPDQLHPNRWSAIKQKKKVEEETGNSLATTDMYTCKKCKDKKFKITELQTRSIDEPITRFVSCVTCGYTFIV